MAILRVKRRLRWQSLPFRPCPFPSLSPRCMMTAWRLLPGCQGDLCAHWRQSIYSCIGDRIAAHQPLKASDSASPAALRCKEYNSSSLEWPGSSGAHGLAVSGRYSRPRLAISWAVRGRVRAERGPSTRRHGASCRRQDADSKLPDAPKRMLAGGILTSGGSDLRHLMEPDKIEHGTGGFSSASARVMTAMRLVWVVEVCSWVQDVSRLLIFSIEAEK